MIYELFKCNNVFLLNYLLFMRIKSFDLYECIMNLLLTEFAIRVAITGFYLYCFFLFYFKNEITRSNEKFGFRGANIHRLKYLAKGNDRMRYNGFYFIHYLNLL